jgi:pyruvate/2-oxoglutarate dehydrogenase complex dihydrolipoamide dehydrogenase (E3) component
MAKVVVIGAGSGGLTSAIGLQKAGFDVTLIEKKQIGGDCTNVGCIPSKALIWRARNYFEFCTTLHSLDSGYARTHMQPLSSFANNALHEVRKIVQHYQKEESPEWVKSKGIKFIPVEAIFVGTHELKVNNNIIDFDYAVVATGSRPLLPDNLDLSNISYYTNETIFTIKKLPKKLVIIGNGIIACELGQAMAHLGVEVTILGRTPSVIPQSDIDAQKVLLKHFKNVGIAYLQKETVNILQDEHSTLIQCSDGSTVATEALLICTGRTPNVHLDLEMASIEYDKDGIFVDQKNQTSNKSIYALGDVIGQPMFTHYADHSAKQLVLNILARHKSKIPFLQPFKRLSSFNNPRVIYTTPEIAEYGYNVEEAQQQFGKVKVLVHSIQNTDRQKIQSKEPGFIKIITAGWFGKIVGVVIVHEHAGEILPEFQRLIQAKKHIWHLRSIIRPYPSATSGLDALVLEWFKRK